MGGTSWSIWCILIRVVQVKGSHVMDNQWLLTFFPYNYLLFFLIVEESDWDMNMYQHVGNRQVDCYRVHTWRSNNIEQCVFVVHIVDNIVYRVWAWDCNVEKTHWRRLSRVYVSHGFGCCYISNRGYGFYCHVLVCGQSW